MNYHVICASFGTTGDGWGNEYNSEYLPLVICDPSRSVAIRNTLLTIQKEVWSIKEPISRQATFWLYILYDLMKVEQLIWKVSKAEKEEAQTAKKQIDALIGEYPVQAFIGSYADDNLPIIAIHNTLVRDVKE